VKKSNIVWLGVSIIMILAILPVLACAPTATPAGTIPMVISTNPANNAQNVASSTLVTATFNEAMNASTLNTTTFTLVQGSTPVSGKVTYAGTKATFTPDVNLELCATYTARITTGAQDPAGHALATDYVWNFSTSCASGTGAPVVGGTTTARGYVGGGVFGGGGGNPAGSTVSATVTATSPTGTCVSVSSPITATFSGMMNASSITNATFMVKQGVTPVAGTVSYTGTKATFTPVGNLPPFSTFTATLTTGVRSQSGIPLPANRVWSFTTCSGPPMVLVTIPINNDLACLHINSAISAIFNEPMNPSTIISPATTFTLMQTVGSIPVAGTVALSLDGLTAVFTPSVDLLPLTQYTATISTGVTDLTGKHMAAPYPWHFTTCALPPDIIPPTLISTIPANLATDVALNTTVTATFDEAMNPLTLNNTTFTLEDTTTSTFVTATSIITIGAVTVFTPNANLINGDTYQAHITTGAQDLAGNSLAAGIAPNPWTFSTLASAPSGPLLPQLNAAGNYTILAETAITTTGTPDSAITGDIGTSSAASLITGFALTLVGQWSTAPNVSGKVYAYDYATPTPANLTAAILAMTNAYTATANTITPAPVVDTGASGELAGLSLPPGVYKFDSSQPNVTLHGNLHLAAVGADDTWIFQIPGTLTVFPGSNVIVDAPGQAKNVYWQVAGVPQIQSSASTPTTFRGVILSYLGIAVGDHAIMHGQALSQAAVTLISDQVGP
jgi:hypothetical protein